MIAVDTSALLEIAMRKPLAGPCMDALQNDDNVIVSAGTLAEAIIVGTGRNVLDEVLAIVDGLPVDVIPVTAATAHRIGETYRRWGKGMNPAGLNFGDCFAYEVAKEHECPLLYVGNDFAKTDIASAL